MIKDFFYRNRYLVLLVFISFLLKALTHQMLLVGGADTLDTWMASKRLLYGLPFEWMHRTTRFGAIIPVFISQLLFSTHPIVYYVAPFLFSFIQVIFLFKLSAKLKNETFAFWTTFCFMVFPEILVCSSHPRISTFSITYMLLFLYFLFQFFERLEKKDGRFRKYFFMAVGFFFVAYLNKVTNLFFFPAILLFIWHHTKRFKYALYFGLSFFALFLIETIIYYFVSPFSLGRFQVIFGTHLQQERLVPVGSFWNLFDRFSSGHMEKYWLIFILVFLVCTLVIFLYKKSDKRIRFLGLLVLCFLFFMTFLVKSINPLIPANTFRTRYLSVLLPMMMICVGYAFYLMKVFFEKKMAKKITLKKAYQLGLMFLLLFFAVFFFQKQYNKQFFKNQPGRSYFTMYPILEVVKSYRLINKSVEENIPIVIKGRVDNTGGYRANVLRVKVYTNQGYSFEEAFKKSGIPRESYEYSLKQITEVKIDGLSTVNSLLLDSKVVKKGQLFHLCPINTNQLSLAILSFKSCELISERFFQDPEKEVALFNYKPVWVKKMRINEILMEK